MKQKTRRSSSAPVEIEIEGGADFNPSNIPRRVQDAIAIIEGLPIGKVIRMDGLASRMKITRGRLSYYSSHSALVPYRINLRNKTALFCNQPTIPLARQKLGL